MQPLPVDAVLGSLQDAVRSGCAAVLVAPTGSGKSTRAAPALLDVVAAEHSVLLLQPRRVAARLLAGHIAAERGSPLGEEVGYRVRFDHRVSARTRLELLTEGLLTRRLLDDPLLDGSGGWGRPVGAVVLDELHERSLHTDLCLSLLREVRQVREDLIVVAMSATMDPGPVAAFLEAQTLVAEGRSFPVDVEHHGPDLHPGDRGLPARVAAEVRDALGRFPEGDVLVFLPGAPEIRRCAELLANGVSPGTGVLQLHGRLPLREQDRALRPAAQLGLRRKIVLSTNIAETSLTLPGVTVVIDSGLVRQPVLDAATGLERLRTTLVSRASADQRAGRAGRVAPGHCVRLWTATQHGRRAAADTPEIERLHLANTVLAAHAWTGDPTSLAWLQPPPVAAWKQATTELTSLGALDDRGITARGRAMLALPTDPHLAAVLLAAADDGQLPLACALVALIAEPDAWSTGSALSAEDRVAAVLGGPARGASPPRLDRLRRAAVQFHRAVAGAPLPRHRGVVDLDACLPALLSGLPGRLGQMRGGRRALKLASGRGAVLARHLPPPPGRFIVALQLRAVSGGADQVELAAAISDEAVEALPRHTTRRTEWVEERGAAVGVVAERVGALVLRRTEGAPDPAEAAVLLEAAAAVDPTRALSPDRDALALIHRVLFLAERGLDAGLPAWSDTDDALRAVLPALCVGRRSLSELDRADLAGALAGSLPWSARQALDRLAPAELRLPTGTRGRLDYDPATRQGGGPVLRARVQQLFGLSRTPTVLSGRVPVTLHLLAPNQRPVQVTTDLPGFWTRTWPDVRKQLRGRYPKHAWPEDPLAAKPEDRPRRRR